MTMAKEKRIKWPSPTNKPNSWWATFHSAANLRTRLGVIEAKTEREQKRAQIAQIKRETFELLHNADIPDPLRMLIVDLWGGTKGFLERPGLRRLTAAAIEGRHPVDPTGQQPSTLAMKQLGVLLRAELGVDTNFNKQIIAWRDDPDYWRDVFQYRPDYHWSPE